VIRSPEDSGCAISTGGGTIASIDRKTRVIRSMAVGHRWYVYEDVTTRLLFLKP